MGALIILDADGVFLSERAYWAAALRTPLMINGIPIPSGEKFRQFLDTAVDQVGLHRVTKRRGCNSNWDLAVVLSKALQSPATAEKIAALLRQRRPLEALQEWNAAAEKLWQGDSGTRRASDQEHDPLEGFGVLRHGPQFERVRAVYQQALSDEGANGGGRCDVVCGSEESVRDALRRLRSAGFTLAVCTGRLRAELIPPMDSFGLTPFFDPKRLVTADDVAAAERALAIRGLGKPHWFPLACAVVGTDRAIPAVTLGRCGDITWHRVVYVGDGLADFVAAEGAQAAGISVAYVHVRSGVTDHSEERRIARAEITVGVVEALADVPSRLQAIPSGNDS